MSERYVVDVDKLIGEIQFNFGCDECKADCGDCIVNKIFYQHLCPLVDTAKEIVQCMDCKWAVDPNKEGRYKCTLHNMRRLFGDFFCSDGEREEES